MLTKEEVSGPCSLCQWEVRQPSDTRLGLLALLDFLTVAWFAPYVVTMWHKEVPSIRSCIEHGSNVEHRNMLLEVLRCAQFSLWGAKSLEKSIMRGVMQVALVIVWIKSMKGADFRCRANVHRFFWLALLQY
jgi:hypothetical protein